MIAKFKTLIKVTVTFIVLAVIVMAAYVKFNNLNNGNFNSVSIDTADKILPDITSANAELENYDVVRGNTEYKIIEVAISKDITKEELGGFKNIDIIDGHISNDYSAVIITLDITNIKDEIRDIYINNNVIDIYDSAMNMVRSGYEIEYMTKTLSNGKSLYKIELKPGETIRERCYYYIEDEYLSDDYIAEYVINPQGVGEDIIINTGNNTFDYIIRYKIKDLIEYTNNYNDSGSR